MPEALIRRFRGFATNLPDTNNAAFAEDVRNVYEKAPGELVRREGCKRAIEYRADAPIRMILPMVEPGGEYTGSGMDVLIQDTSVRGEASPRSNISPSSPTTPSGGASIDYSPAIVWFTQTARTPSTIWGVILGRNFDAEVGVLPTITVVEYPSGGGVFREAPVVAVHYRSPTRVEIQMRASWWLPWAQILVTLTNPDGQQATWQGAPTINVFEEE
jgi:hypothetical protein